MVLALTAVRAHDIHAAAETAIVIMVAEACKYAVC